MCLVASEVQTMPRQCGAFLCRVWRVCQLSSGKNLSLCRKNLYKSYGSLLAHPARYLFGRVYKGVEHCSGVFGNLAHTQVCYPGYPA